MNVDTVLTRAGRRSRVPGKWVLVRPSEILEWESTLNSLGDFGIP